MCHSVAHVRQHSSQYSMSDRDILVDIVSYCPGLAGASTKNTTVKAIRKHIGTASL